MSFPSFKGDSSEDLEDFLTRFERAATFYAWADEKKARALPMFLKGDASHWFTSLPSAKKITYDNILDALREHYDSAANQWILLQQLGDRKQKPTESVHDYSAYIRRQCQRLKISRDNWLHYFVQGLRSDLKNHVVLQSPPDFETAVHIARLKEAVTSTEPTVAAITERLSKRIWLQKFRKFSLQPSNNPLLLRTLHFRPTISCALHTPPTLNTLNGMIFAK